MIRFASLLTLFLSTGTASAHEVDPIDDLSGRRCTQANYVSPIVEAAIAQKWRLVLWLPDNCAPIWAIDEVGQNTGDVAAAMLGTPQEDIVPKEELLVLREVVAHLRKAGFPWPLLTPDRVRTIKAAGKWPPSGR